MAQARQVARQLPHIAIYLVAALFATITIGAVVAFGMLGPMRIDQPATNGGLLSPALIQAGRDWQVQREQQSGFVDPLTQAGRDWEAQREQQGGFVDPLTQAGRDWEAQREQQSVTQP